MDESLGIPWWMVQWLGRPAFTTKGTGSVAGWETKISQGGIASSNPQKKGWISKKNNLYTPVKLMPPSFLNISLLGSVHTVPNAWKPLHLPDSSPACKSQLACPFLWEALQLGQMLPPGPPQCLGSPMTALITRASSVIQTMSWINK